MYYIVALNHRDRFELLSNIHPTIFGAEEDLKKIKKEKPTLLRDYGKAKVYQFKEVK